MAMDDRTLGVRNALALPALVAAVTLACLLPFLHKAYHVDDTLFLMVARQIRTAPWNFFGFGANWYGRELPMSFITKNPPLASYYLALAGSLFGWSEVALHAALLPVAVAAALGTFFLGREFEVDGLVAALVAVLTPVFLVSSTTVMCDTMMLAFWVWAVLCWLRGVRTASWPLLLAAGLLVAAGTLTKYFGLALLPLFAVHALAWRRNLGRNLLMLLVPVALLAAFQLATWRLYGQGMVSAAGLYSLTFKKTGQGFLGGGVRGLVFIGGCLAPALFFAPLLWRRTWLLAGLLAALLLTVLLLRVPGLGIPEPMVSGPQILMFALTFWLCLVAGGQILCLALAQLRARREPGDLLLLSWVFGTFVFATYLNWTLTARSVLPMAPAVGILLARRLAAREPALDWKRLLPLVPALCLGLAVAGADYSLAGAGRQAAATILKVFNDGRRTVWFQGHWGFQHYMEAGGAQPLDYLDTTLHRGDVVVIPANNTNTFPLFVEYFKTIGQMSFRLAPGMATISHPLGAGFYSTQWGTLPFAFGQPPAETYAVYMVVRTSGQGDFHPPFTF